MTFCYQRDYATVQVVLNPFRPARIGNPCVMRSAFKLNDDQNHDELDLPPAGLRKVAQLKHKRIYYRRALKRMRNH